MLNKPVIIINQKISIYLRIFLIILILLLTLLSLGAYLLLETKKMAMLNTYQVELKNTDLLTEAQITPFPISIDPNQKKITQDENTEFEVELFANTYLSLNKRDRWFDKAVGFLSKNHWFQNLATPSTRIVVIFAGERKEQIANNIGNVLRWTEEERNQFKTEITKRSPSFPEGTFFPGRYVVPVDAGPVYVANIINNRFQRSVLLRYPNEIETIVPLIDTLTFASLLEREAYDFYEKRIISGIMWNRMFIDMKLQIDATLQYSKANKNSYNSNWWPVPRPEDKFINSPFNTYKHYGLPPSPIANPSISSILATLNPTQTDCIFYFHDRNGGFHCSKTYDEHIQGIRIHYGN